MSRFKVIEDHYPWSDDKKDDEIERTMSGFKFFETLQVALLDHKCKDLWELSVKTMNESGWAHLPIRGDMHSIRFLPQVGDKPECFIVEMGTEPNVMVTMTNRAVCITWGSTGHPFSKDSKEMIYHEQV